MKDFSIFKVKESSTIREAVKKLDSGGIGFIVIISDSGHVAGVLTDGDFRRAVLNGEKLDNPVSKVMNREYISIGADHTDEDIARIFRETKADHIPVIDAKHLVDIITADDFYGRKKDRVQKTVDAEVVIMAGGKGTRLDPFTRILPKPLIPIGNKAMIEVIMEEYNKFGMHNFYISINHKAKMVRAYFEEHDGLCNIRYLNEDKPLGTIGAISQLSGKIDSPFFVSNCDILIKDDYSEIFKFHCNGGYIFTIVASMRHHTIPYGVCEIHSGGELKNLNEKPGYDFLVNTGMYVCSPEIMTYIPNDTFYNITDLVDTLRKSGEKIGVYPVSEESYLDIGQWEYFKSTVDRILTEL